MTRLAHMLTPGPQHRWQKGPQCLRCGLLRRDRERASLDQPDRLVTCVEYSRDGVVWAEGYKLRSPPPCEVS